MITGAFAAAAPKPPQPLPPNSNPHGHSYAEWSAAWWTWAMEHPVAGHPFIDDPSFDVTSGQTGHMWFLAAPFGTVTRCITIPTGTALFVGILNAEASDLEGLGSTTQERTDTAHFLADHIVDPFCEIDGFTVRNIGSYRVTSPEFSFDAPTPWIFGDTGGEGVSVADGYYVMIQPLPAGAHTIHYGGGLHFAIDEGDPFDLDASIDMTYELTVH
jgi:hypothetical protein